MLLGKFFRSCFSLIPRRISLFVALNWLFFGVMFAGNLLSYGGYGGFYEWPMGEDFVDMETRGLPLMVTDIFLFNLVVSGFVLVTLSGLLFFALPFVFLLFRAFLWGVLLGGLPTSLFLAAFPTLILEGEGYVLASLAGINLGLSWLRPEWAYEGEELSRLESVKKALRDCVRVYVLVAVLLFVAAVVEALTFTLIF